MMTGEGSAIKLAKNGNALIELISILFVKGPCRKAKSGLGGGVSHHGDKIKQLL